MKNSWIFLLGRQELSLRRGKRREICKKQEWQKGDKRGRSILYKK